MSTVSLVNWYPIAIVNISENSFVKRPEPRSRPVRFAPLRRSGYSNENTRFFGLKTGYWYTLYYRRMAVRAKWKV